MCALIAVQRSRILDQLDCNVCTLTFLYALFSLTSSASCFSFSFYCANDCIPWSKSNCCCRILIWDAYNVHSALFVIECAHQMRKWAWSCLFSNVSVMMRASVQFLQNSIVICHTTKTEVEVRAEDEIKALIMVLISHCVCLCAVCFINGQNGTAICFL